MGQLSDPTTFGHNGSNCCIGFVEPRRRLTVVYLTNRLQAGLEGSPHLTAVNDALLSACD